MQKQVDLTKELDPKPFTEELNNRYAADKSPSLFTMSLGRIDFSTDTLSFCQAGAPNAYILSADPNRVSSGLVWVVFLSAIQRT